MSTNDPSAFGKYRLIAELGHGGMADVFLAVQQGLAGFSKLVVLKRLRPNLADDPEFVAMLLDEARIAARLNHPNVVQTNEIGNVGNHYYIAMEYLDGQPLHRVTHRANARGGVPHNYYYALLMDVLAGLRHAHTLQDFDGTPLDVVHRDVTPHNVFVTYDGSVKIVDFGIAKAVGRASGETRQGVIKGKIGYMSPEQATGMHVDARSDVFAVGIMLWEAAVGHRMWKGVEDMQIMRRLIAGDIPSSPRAVKPDVPEEIDRICQRAMAPMDERYASADEMRADIDKFLGTTGQRPSSREVGDFVSDLFQDKRTELKEIIETKLAELKSLPVDQFVPFMMSGPASTTGSFDRASDLPEEGKTAMTGVTQARRVSGGAGVSSKVVLGGTFVIVALMSAGLVMRAKQSGPPPMPANLASTAPVIDPTPKPAVTTAPSATVAVDSAQDAGVKTVAATRPVVFQAAPKTSTTTNVVSPAPTKKEDDGLTTRN